MIIGVLEIVPLSVTIGLSGCANSTEANRECLLLVQSYILSWVYAHQSFFVESTLHIVRETIANAEVFSVSPEFELWHGLRSAELDGFIAIVDPYIVNSCWSAESPAILTTTDIARPIVKPGLDTVLLAVRPVLLPIQSAETINQENL